MPVMPLRAIYVTRQGSQGDLSPGIGNDRYSSKVLGVTGDGEGFKQELIYRLTTGTVISGNFL
jgi:hypothetical protein